MAWQHAVGGFYGSSMLTPFFTNSKKNSASDLICIKLVPFGTSFKNSQAPLTTCQILAHDLFTVCTLFFATLKVLMTFVRI